MCTRFYLTAPIEALRTAYGARGGIEHPARYNIAPTQPVVIVRLKPGAEASRARELALVRWGLIPHWVKDPREFGTLVTARAETALDKPSFKTPMRHRRCIVPADGWYAWAGKPGDKQAYLLRPREAKTLALAALWEHWLGRDGSEIETLAVLTAPANADVKAIDDRMPIVLRGAAIDAWLDVRGTNQDEAAALLKHTAEEPLETNDTIEAIAIRSAINNPDAEGPEMQTELQTPSKAG